MYYSPYLLSALNDISDCTLCSGKRRALIPPSLGYINENLEPIPDEVCRFFVFLALYSSKSLTFSSSLYGSAGLFKLVYGMPSM